MKYKILFYFIFILFLNTTLFSKTTSIYYYDEPLYPYGLEILNLTLEQTKSEFGDYDLIPTPPMNHKRAILTLKSDKLDNLVLKLSVSEKIMSDFSCINFPIDRGIVGYRVAFISPKTKETIEEYNTLEKLKKLKIGQGVGWLDIDILKYNGFEVRSLSSKESIFNMLSLNRLDLFLRGINEIPLEFEEFNYIKNINLEKTFVIYYPLPRFFCTKKSNKLLFERLEKGLNMAYQDGSLDRLFNKYYKKSIDYLDIKNRKLYEIENPFIKNIDKSYEKYIYNPYKWEIK